MKQTLLEIVQSVLNELDSDQVNSIDDTVEAQQVAHIVKDCFFEIISNRNWPHLKTLLQLEHSGTTDRPNYLMLPEGIKEMIEVRYDVVDLDDLGVEVRYKKLKWKEPEEFLTYTHNRLASRDNMEVITDFSGVRLIIQNDKAPDYWTTFDDEWLVLDSYDLAVDDAVQKWKTSILCYKEPSWSMQDSFIPDLPEEAFSLLIEESKSVAFLTLKQMVNQKAEQKAARQQRWLSRKAWRAQGGVRFPNYGRK